MADFEFHKGLKERRGIDLRLETEFVDWLIEKGGCSCLVAYYHLSVKEIRKFYEKWINKQKDI